MAILVPSNTVTSSGNAPINLSLPESVVFQLNVTAAATAAGDTLDVYLQSSVDGTTWDDFVHFTQVLGNGGAKRFIAQWNSRIAPTAALHAATDGSLAAGVAQGPVGSTLRAKWVVVSASAPSFTFSIVGASGRNR